MKTKKRIKRKFNYKRFLILVLFLYLFGYGIYYVFSRPIKNIIITGNRLVSDVSIIDELGIRDYPGLFTLSKSKMKKTLLNNPLIEDVTIKRNLHFQLLINIKEKRVVLYNKSNEMYVLSDGSTINDKAYIGIPVLNNYTPEDILKEFAGKLGKLDSSIIGAISEMEYTPSKNDKDEVIDNTRFKLKMNDGNTVYINVKKCDVLAYYNEIYASLNGKKGVLNLDSGNYERYLLTLYEEWYFWIIMKKWRK